MCYVLFNVYVLVVIFFFKHSYNDEDAFVGANPDLVESSNDKHMFELVLNWARAKSGPRKTQAGRSDRTGTYILEYFEVIENRIINASCTKTHKLLWKLSVHS